MTADYDYAYDEVDSGIERIVGGSEPDPPRRTLNSSGPPPLDIAQPKVSLRSFFPEGWLFSLEQLEQTPVVER